MYKTTENAGYSLIEVLVSISVLLIAIVGPMTIASQGIKSAAFSLEQNTAFFLAQEGIETVIALRNDSTLAYLEDIESGGSSVDQFDWFTEGLYGSGNICSGVSGACSFGLDFRDSTLSNNFSSDTCESDEENCRLYERQSNSRAVYAHVSGSATSSPFVRIITVEETSPGSEVVDVTVEVKWKSHVFGGAEQSVKLSTELYKLI